MFPVFPRWILLSFVLALTPSLAEVPAWTRVRAKGGQARSASRWQPRRVALDPGDHRVLPEVLNGGGFRTKFFLTNLDAKAIFYELNLYDDFGDSMQLGFERLGSVSRIFGRIPPLASVALETRGNSSDVESGYAVLFTLDKPADDADSRITHDRLAAVTSIRYELNGVALETSVPQTSESESEVTMPFDARGRSTSIIEVINSFERDVSQVELAFRDVNGDVLHRERFPAEAFNKYALILPDDVPALKDKFGIVTVTGSSALLSTVAFRLGDGFTTILPTALPPDVNPSAPSEAVDVASLPGVDGCGPLFGGLVFSRDGKFLGRISTSQHAADSIANRYGPFGSNRESQSLWNQSGEFGSPSGDLSAANPSAAKPPLLYIEGKPAALVTANEALGKRLTLDQIGRCINR